MKLLKSSLCLTICLMLLFSVNVSGLAPYEGYNYDSFGQSQPSPNGYEVSSVTNLYDLVPQDAEFTDFCFANGRLYLLDGGSGKIFIMNEQLKPLSVIDYFTYNGKESPLSEPVSLFVDKNNRIAVADAGNQRAVVCDLTGNISNEFKAPSSDIFSSELQFSPKKVLMDQLGNTYVLCDGFYYGALVYNASGEYNGFFGANKVEMTLEVVSEMFWRKFMTKQQKAYSSKYVPIEYTSFDIDDKDFIYTCSMSTLSSTDEIKKLNAVGNNILQIESGNEFAKKNDYGDKEKIWQNDAKEDSKLIDIKASQRKLIYALDYTYGRVFTYDQDSNLLFVFGGKGNSKGLHSVVTAVECIGDDVLVLDSEKNEIVRYSPTEYGATVINAVSLYSAGKYQEALGDWKTILSYQSNSELANRGVGRALLQNEKYKESLPYLKAGQDRSGYSKAFRNYRIQLVRKNFSFIMTGIVLIVILVFVLKSLRKRRHEYTEKTIKTKKYINPFYVLVHPVDGFNELRLMGSTAPLIVTGVLAFSWMITDVFSRQCTGFIFNFNNLGELNIIVMSAKTIGIFIAFCLCNWAIGGMTDGEATIRRVFVCIGYALLPMILTSVAATALSNVLTFEESAIISLIKGIGLIYTVLMLLIGIFITQQYTFGKTVISVALTLMAVAFLLLVLVLAFALLQHLYSFIMTIINELMFRM